MSYKLSLKLRGPDGADVVLVEGARVVWSDPAATDGVDVAGTIRAIRVYDDGDEAPCAAVDVVPDLGGVGDLASITDPRRAAASGNLRIVELPVHCIAMPRGPSDPPTFMCRSGERLGAIDPAERSKHAQFPYGARDAYMARADACPDCVAALVEPSKRVFRALSEGGALTPAQLCEQTGLPWRDVDDGIVSLREIVASSFGDGPQRFWLRRDEVRQQASAKREACEALRQAHADLEDLLHLAHGIGRKVAEVSERLGDDAGGTPNVDAVGKHDHLASAAPMDPDAERSGMARAMAGTPRSFWSPRADPQTPWCPSSNTISMLVEQARQNGWGTEWATKIESSILPLLGGVAKDDALEARREYRAIDWTLRELYPFCMEKLSRSMRSRRDLAKLMAAKIEAAIAEADGCASALLASASIVDEASRTAAVDIFCSHDFDRAWSVLFSEGYGMGSEETELAYFLQSAQKRARQSYVRVEPDVVAACRFGLPPLPLIEDLCALGSASSASSAD